MKLTDQLQMSSLWNTFMYSTTLFIILLLTLPFLPNKFSSIRFNARFALYYVAACTMSLVTLPYYLFRPCNVKNNLISAYIVKGVAPLLGIKFELRNKHLLQKDEGCVVVSNHQSTLDILGMFTHWHVAGKLTAIAKKELMYVPAFGLSSYLSGIVFIDRSNAKAAYDTLQKTSKVMLKEKTKILIFPEGTRNLKMEQPMLPFKRGAFQIAVEAQVPIIPLVFSPYYFLNRKTKFFDSRGHIIMQALDPIPTTGLTKDDIPDLIKRTRETMITCYQQLTKEIVKQLPSDYPGVIPGQN